MTATGLPFLVTVTRSCVPATSSITWLKCALTAASDCVVMTLIVVSPPFAVKQLGRCSCRTSAHHRLSAATEAMGTGERAER